MRLREKKDHSLEPKFGRGPGNESNKFASFFFQKKLNQIRDLLKFPFATNRFRASNKLENLNRVGDQGIEPCTSRTRIEHSTDELVPVVGVRSKV